jgi:hypothetical protein
VILWNFLQRLGAALRAWRHDWSERQQNRYRPERHYMRGPGPKFQAKITKDAQ